MDRKPAFLVGSALWGCKRSYRTHIGFHIPPLQRLQEQIYAHSFLCMLIQDRSHRKPKVVVPFHLCNFSAVYSPCEGEGVYPKRLDVAI